MKTIFISLGLILASAQSYADTESCPRGCHPPRPREVHCKVEMVDCYNRSLYIYTGTAWSHQAACQAATRACLTDVNRGYGGWGSKCWMIGKKNNMSY